MEADHLTATARVEEDESQVVDEPVAKDAPRKLGPLLDEEDDTKVAKRVVKMRERQMKRMLRLFAVWQRNKLWRQGHRYVRLDRSEDKWEAKVPLGMASAPPLPNKNDRLCRRVANTLLSDDPIVEAEPSSDTAEDTDAAEFATRALRIEGAETGYNIISLTKRAADKAGTYASAFAYWYVDPTGGGRVPKQVKAHPKAVVYESPEQVVLDPETGAGAASESEYVDRYVRPDGTLTENKLEADYTWLPKIQNELLTGHHVQFLPEKVDGIANARGVLLLLPTTLGELKESYPDVMEEFDDATLKKLCNWRPQGCKETLPEFVELQERTDDDGKPDDQSIVFALHLFYVSHGEYPEGAHICVVDDKVLCKETHVAEVEGPKGTTEIEYLDIPIAQCRQLDDNTTDDPYGIALSEKLGPMDEIRAQVYSYALDHLHRFGNPHTFLPDGSALVSERDTERVLLVGANGDVRRVGRVRGVDGTGEGGLLGLAVSPDFAADAQVFAYFTAGNENVVARMTFDGRRLSNQRRILSGIPGGPIHNGGRIAFGPDGFLYVGTGEAGRTELSQRRGSLGGKILRITADGEPAPGNPFAGSPVYSLGHRNVQGLAWDERGQLWAAEFGQNEWDELNRIEPGGNYGWPEVEGRGGDDRFIDPVRQWRTDVASPSGIAVAQGSVFMAGLRGARLWQIPIAEGRVGRPRALLTERYGRLRTVVAAPDGSLWLTTSNRDGRGSPRAGDDRILRLVFR